MIFAFCSKIFLVLNFLYLQIINDFKLNINNSRNAYNFDSFIIEMS